MKNITTDEIIELIKNLTTEKKIELIEKKKYLDVFIIDEEWRFRYEVAEQGYGLDKLVHDENCDVRELAKKLNETQIDQIKRSLDTVHRILMLGK